jgi:hypothetical protein
MDQVEVYVKNIYGRDAIYPANETAMNLCLLAGQKTLTPREIKLIRRLGYKVVQVHAPHKTISDLISKQKV